MASSSELQIAKRMAVATAYFLFFTETDNGSIGSAKEA